jgi:hypothetical protein
MGSIDNTYESGRKDGHSPLFDVHNMNEVDDILKMVASKEV